jgi:DNA-binding transcriptional MerR regulator
VQAIGASSLAIDAECRTSSDSKFKAPNVEGFRMTHLRIGALSERTGTPAATIRYYEQIGLLRKAARLGGGQRVYSRGDVERLTFVRRCREFDFSIEQIRKLVSLTQDPDSSCMAARDLAAEHLAAVRVRVRELRSLERSLLSFVEACETSCAGGPGPECVVLSDLGKRRGAVPAAK